MAKKIKESEGAVLMLKAFFLVERLAREERTLRTLFDASIQSQADYTEALKIYENKMYIDSGGKPAFHIAPQLAAEGVTAAANGESGARVYSGTILTVMK